MAEKQDDVRMLSMISLVSVMPQFRVSEHAPYIIQRLDLCTMVKYHLRVWRVIRSQMNSWWTWNLRLWKTDGDRNGDGDGEQLKDVHEENRKAIYDPLHFRSLPTGKLANPAGTLDSAELAIPISET